MSYKLLLAIKSGPRAKEDACLETVGYNRARTPGRRKPLCRRFSRGVRVTTSYPEILWESSSQRLQVGMEVFPRGRWNQALAGDDPRADHAFDILLAAGGPGQLDPMCNACPEESIGRAMPRRRRCIA